ncbi:MAG: glycosyltransferase family 4 protein [Bdellovibrionaceae bacterium]|nr:glycosyltransferase family 4 protein [Pseudobdellovibrionaceae bacterium]
MARAQVPEKLNICLVGQRFPVMGRASDEGFLWPMTRGLIEKGHQVTVISTRSPTGKPELLRDGVRLLYLHEGYPNKAGIPFPEAALEKFTELHKEKPFDLVHSFDRSGYLIGRKRRRLNFAMTYDVEATQMSQLFSILGMAQDRVSSLLATGIALTYKFLTTYFGGDRDLLVTADGVFVTSPQQRVFLERYYMYPDFNIFSVPYGVELSQFKPPMGEESPLRARFKLPENTHVVLTVTDMTVPEEIVTLLQAFERVAVKKPNAYMVILGSGPEWKRIEYEMLNLALGSRVIMPGALKEEEVSEWIQIADVFVNMSSRTTGFEPTMIEAMAQKKVIIGSELSPMANIVEDGQDGFLLRPADTDSLAQLLVELFSGTMPSFEIGQKARDKVTNLFDPRKMVEALHGAYRQVLSHRN